METTDWKQMIEFELMAVMAIGSFGSEETRGISNGMDLIHPSQLVIINSSNINYGQIIDL
jgi:hypothetical protein